MVLNHINSMTMLPTWSNSWRHHRKTDAWKEMYFCFAKLNIFLSEEQSAPGPQTQQALILPQFLLSAYRAGQSHSSRHWRSGWMRLWAPWLSCGYLCSLQGTWTRWPFQLKWFWDSMKCSPTISQPARCQRQRHPRQSAQLFTQQFAKL